MNPIPVPVVGTAVPPPSHAGWTLHVVASADSTNRLARTFAPWHAIRADVQTGGYGRTGRTWISDAGGLWLSAVLPCPGPRERWEVLPLAVGHALISALTGLGAASLRLRWPNDILSGRRKLAGLLVERHDAHTAVVGIGINIFDRFARRDHPPRRPDLARRPNP
jgi:BirA family transcriptional regulator, biotin operon repressor / biotin---[acetyl-CoA-carboxylase] ligase